MANIIGYTSRESKRILKMRLEKIRYLGELTRLFGKDIILIPKLGVKIFYDLNEKEKSFVRREARNIGSVKYQEFISFIFSASNFLSKIQIISCLHVWDPYIRQ